MKTLEKIWIVQTMEFPMTFNGSKIWTLKKPDRKSIAIWNWRIFLICQENKQMDEPRVLKWPGSNDPTVDMLSEDLALIFLKEKGKRITGRSAARWISYRVHWSCVTIINLEIYNEMKWWVHHGRLPYRTKWGINYPAEILPMWLQRVNFNLIAHNQSIF